MKRLAATLALLVALDAATTLYALSSGFVEVGLFVSKLLPVLGPFYFLVVEYPVLLALALLGRAAPRGASMLEKLPLIVAALAVLNNLAWILSRG